MHITWVSHAHHIESQAHVEENTDMCSQILALLFHDYRDTNVEHFIARPFKKTVFSEILRGS